MAEHVCKSLWVDEVISLGDDLCGAYRDRLESENLMPLAKEASTAKGEPGGQSSEDSDKHFAWRFANSAGRSVYVSLDPLKKLGEVSDAVTSSLLDGEVVLVDVPCGGGAGVLGLLCAIYEKRRAGILATLPLNIRIVAGDYSQRAREHLRAMLAAMSHRLATQEIHVTLTDFHWDASDVRTSAELINAAVDLCASADRIMLLVSNFSAALSASKDLRSSFEQFLSQFVSRLGDRPSLICWIEPNTAAARELLPGFDTWIERFLAWLKKIDGGRVSATAYQMRDPLTGKVYGTGVTVLRCDSENLLW